MKRIYIEPSTKVVKIAVSQMLTASPYGTAVSNKSATGDALGREADFDWDED